MLSTTRRTQRPVRRTFKDSEMIIAREVMDLRSRHQLSYPFHRRSGPFRKGAVNY